MDSQSDINANENEIHSLTALFESKNLRPTVWEYIDTQCASDEDFKEELLEKSLAKMQALLRINKYENYTTLRILYRHIHNSYKDQFIDFAVHLLPCWKR